MRQHVLGQQHLPRHQIVLGERIEVAVHQASLPDCRRHLEPREIGRPGVEAQRRQPGGNGAR